MIRVLLQNTLLCTVVAAFSTVSAYRGGKVPTPARSQSDFPVSTRSYSGDKPLREELARDILDIAHKTAELGGIPRDQSPVLDEFSAAVSEFFSTKSTEGLARWMSENAGVSGFLDTAREKKSRDESNASKLLLEAFLEVRLFE